MIINARVMVLGFSILSCLANVNHSPVICFHVIFGCYYAFYASRCYIVLFIDYFSVLCIQSLLFIFKMSIFQWVMKGL